MDHGSVKVTALNFIRPSLLPEDLYTLTEMNHVSIEMNFINSDKLYKLYKLWSIS